jgi:CubicO group peptidase (beta-lactamase class C family)
MGELLTHDSGLFDVTINMPTLAGPTDDAYLSQYLTSTGFQQSTWFNDPPGSFFDYSNTGYMLAGLAVERLAGVAYPEAVRRYVTAPLGMDRAMFRPDLVVADGDYTNATPDGVQDVSPLGTDNAAVRPSGMEFASVLDFAKFIEFLSNGDDAVLSRRQWQAMQAPQVSTLGQGPVSSYGYGVYVDTGIDYGPTLYYPGTTLTHTGEYDGWLTFYSLHKDTGFGFVVFQNTEAGNGFNGTFQYALKHIGGLTATNEPPGVAPDPSLFPTYVGTYDETHDIVGHIIVTDVNGTMTVSMPDLDGSGIPYDPTLTPFTKDNFFATVAGGPLQFTFVRDSTGLVRWIRSNDLFVCERTSP